jgi:hypothetical protein
MRKAFTFLGSLTGLAVAVWLVVFFSKKANKEIEA